MKVVKLKENIYRRAEKLSKTRGVKVDALISQALNEGLEAVNEKTVLELYRNRKITLQKAAEILSTDIWDMIERVKKTDIHIDYSKEELAEDLR
ncbi:MAG: UPF0175 family protein [Nitrospirae bacterium]|nr:UPF0175 family protein [Nitrospirota bacterium]